MASLFEKSLLIFSGKGGSGKSTVACAAAVAAARRGKRVLIVEIGEEERISAIFGNARRSGYAGGQVSMPQPGIPPIWSMCLTPREALREFAVRSVKFDLLYQAIFENPVMRYFTAAAPGLNELTLMGKIEYLHRDAVVPAPNARFDLMIFDAPPTGQVLALLQASLTAMGMAPVGPLHTMVERMWRLVSNPATTAINIVTVPEEMSVNEAFDLFAAVQTKGIPSGKVIVNGVHPDFFPHELAALRQARQRSAIPSDLTGRVARAVLDAAVSSAVQRAAEEAMSAKLAAGLPLDRVTLPFIFQPRIGPEELGTLANALDGC